MMRRILAIPDRDVGELIGQVKAMAKDVGKLEGQVGVLDVKVDGILSQLDKIAGGYATLIWVGGVVGAIASVLTAVALKAFPFILGGLPRL